MIPQTTFVLTFWPHIISELDGVPSLISMYDVHLDDNQIIGNKPGAYTLYLIFMYLCELQ